MSCFGRRVPLKEALVLAHKVKFEVNRRYTNLEIDIDGVFRSIILVRKKKYAAMTIEDHPMAMQMRFLQTLVEVGAENNTTLVFPVPMELLQTFVREAPPVKGRVTPERHSGGEAA